MNLWQFAIKILLADRGKLITALIGVAFSIVLVNVQGGLFMGLIRKASVLVDNGHADIWVGHKRMHCVDVAMDIPLQWSHRVQAVPGVATVEPYIIGFTNMGFPDGGYEGVVIIGVERTHLLGNAWRYSKGGAESIRLVDGIAVDECEDLKLQYPRMGELREITGRRARVVAKSHGITNFLIAPYVFTTFDRAVSYLGRSPNQCSYFLVQTAEGVDPYAVCQRIRSRIPELNAFTRQDFSRMSVKFWLMRTGMGISFGAATLIGLWVGFVMVSQTLHAMALDRLREFGTLKAIGAGESQIYGLWISQAIAIAVAGSIVGLALTLVIQRQFDTPIAPIVIPGWLSLGSCLLLLVICLISSAVPYLRLRRVDPHHVLTG